MDDRTNMRRRRLWGGSAMLAFALAISLLAWGGGSPPHKPERTDPLGKVRLLGRITITTITAIQRIATKEDLVSRAGC